MELENPNFLPEEILIEIFSRLPAKAVGRCRCLSKTWRTHLSTSQFVKLHLLNRTTNPENLLLSDYSPNSPVHTIDAPTVDNTVSRIFDLGITWNEVLGSCNGLVLLSNTRKRELFLVNPSTHQHFKLPPLSSRIECFSFMCNQYGLGYDSLSDDYKVVNLTFCYVKTKPLGFERTINVYSVKSGAWKMIGDSHDCFGITRMHGGAFVNGAIHWHSFPENTGSHKMEYVIGTFEFAGDVFHEIPAPPVACSLGLLVLEGCLCLSTHNSSDNIDIWMMKQYGLADSWTKLTIATNAELRVSSLLCSIGDSEIIFESYDGTLAVYNLREGTTEVMIVDGVPVGYLKGVAFVDSLVSPNHQYSN